MEIMWPFPASSFRILRICEISGRNRFSRHLFLVIAPGSKFRKLTWFLTFICRGNFPRYFNHQPAKVCISQPSLRRRVLNCFLPSRQVSLWVLWVSIFDAIGWFMDEALVETVEVRFISMGSDFASMLSSSFCSCILFAIVSGQLVKRRFWAQQRELKWLMLKRCATHLVWNYLCQYVYELMFGVDVPDLNLAIQTNPIKQPVQSNSCLIVGLLLFIIILITASLSSKTYNIAPNREDLTLDETWSVFHVECGVARQVSLRLLTFGFVDLVWWRMNYFNC